MWALAGESQIVNRVRRRPLSPYVQAEYSSSWRTSLSLFPSRNYALAISTRLNYCADQPA